MTLYFYTFDTSACRILVKEAEVWETENQYRVAEPGENHFPYMDRDRIFKSEIGVLIPAGEPNVVLMEPDGLKVRQLLLDYFKRKLTIHQSEVARYDCYVKMLQGK